MYDVLRIYVKDNLIFYSFDSENIKMRNIQFLKMRFSDCLAILCLFFYLFQMYST